jgi:hypothetical protein
MSSCFTDLNLGMLLAFFPVFSIFILFYSTLLYSTLLYSIILFFLNAGKNCASHMTPINSDTY